MKPATDSTPEKIAAQQMKLIESDFIRQLAEKLENAEPEGIDHADGAGAGWVPRPAHFNEALVDAHTVIERIEADQKHPEAFAAKRYCKSWYHRWWLAEAAWREVPGLPQYVIDAAAGISRGALAESRANAAIRIVAMTERRRDKARAKATRDAEHNAYARGPDAKLAKAREAIARLTALLKKAEGKAKAVRTRLKKAQRAEARLVKKVTASP